MKVPIDEHNYIIEDPIYATVSKFSIVDLAGSERYRNTFNSGMFSFKQAKNKRYKRKKILTSNFFFYRSTIKRSG